MWMVPGGEKSRYNARLCIMLQTDEAGGGVSQMQRHDSRIMRYGHALRKTESGAWILTSPRKRMRRAYAADQLFLVGLHMRVSRATP